MTEDIILRLGRSANFAKNLKELAVKLLRNHRSTYAKLISRLEQKTCFNLHFGFSYSAVDLFTLASYYSNSDSRYGSSEKLSTDSKVTVEIDAAGVGSLFDEPSNSCAAKNFFSVICKKDLILKLYSQNAGA